MLFFDKYGIRIYAVELQSPAQRHSPLRDLAERAAVKQLLREIYPDIHDLRVGHYPGGAPFLTLPSHDGNTPDRPLGNFPPISISHSRGMVAIALGEHGMRIGIDTETPDRYHQLQHVASRFLAPEQMDWAKHPATLSWAWCIKEAAYKAAGIPGLSLADIPLPMEIPLNNWTRDGILTVADRQYVVLQIDTYPITALLFLVFAPVPDEER